jgi:hypothetical protein
MRRLLIRPGGIGDFLVSLPAMECLRVDRLEVWSHSRNLPLARFAQATASIASTGLDLVGITEAPESLWRRLSNFDSIVSWYGAGRAEFRDALSSFPVTFFEALPPPDWAAHASAYYLAQVSALTACPTEGVPRIACAAERADFIAIQPFSGSPKKNWPLERFQELASLLPLPVRWCAGPEEDLPDCVRFDDLYELGCWLASARLYIGNDSGISHLAAAAGTPVVALFGPTDPAVWAPRGSNVKVIRAPRGDLAALDARAVAAVVLHTLRFTCA